MKRKTLVLGASTNPQRYAYIATNRLLANGEEVIPVGIKEGQIDGVAIRTDQPKIEDVDTITLYLNPLRQREYYDYVLDLAPRRIIFNPGTENPELINLAKARGIEAEVACTLVLLATGVY